MAGKTEKIYKQLLLGLIFSGLYMATKILLPGLETFWFGGVLVLWLNKIE